MNKRQIITELEEKYPGKTIICLPEDNPTEILCEIESTADHPEYSNAISVIDSSVPHYHNKLTETYKVLKGSLKVFVDDKEHSLSEGAELVIKPKQIHYAIGDETWIECRSAPGWVPEDHILVDGSVRDA
jgi:mannose-6-phosphate isomerase-like protein (cupin superfamily)